MHCLFLRRRSYILICTSQGELGAVAFRTTVSCMRRRPSVRTDGAAVAADQHFAISKFANGIDYIDAQNKPLLDCTSRHEPGHKFHWVDWDVPRVTRRSSPSGPHHVRSAPHSVRRRAPVLHDRARQRTASMPFAAWIILWIPSTLPHAAAFERRCVWWMKNKEVGLHARRRPYMDVPSRARTLAREPRARLASGEICDTRTRTRSLGERWRP